MVWSPGNTHSHPIKFPAAVDRNRNSRDACSLDSDRPSKLLVSSLADADLLGVTFSASTDLRMGFQVNDKDSGVNRILFDMLTGETGTVGLSLESGLYCVDVTLVN